MFRWKLTVALSMLAACSSDATAPSHRPLDAATTGPRSTTLQAPSMVLIAPGQLVTLEYGDGATERAWIQAELIVSNTREPTPVHDGAIIVVSANDGPVPQASPDAVKLRIEVDFARMDSEGVVHFRGLAVVTDAIRERASFEVVGSAQTRAGFNPDDLIIDIVGGDAYGPVRFTARGVVLDLAIS